MRLARIAIGATLWMLLAPIAGAGEVEWTGPGWYQVIDAKDAGWLWAGPFASKPDCERTLPPSDAGAEFYCAHFPDDPKY